MKKRQANMKIRWIILGCIGMLFVEAVEAVIWLEMNDIPALRNTTAVMACTWVIAMVSKAMGRYVEQ